MLLGDTPTRFVSKFAIWTPLDASWANLYLLLGDTLGSCPKNEFTKYITWIESLRVIWELGTNPDEGFPLVVYLNKTINQFITVRPENLLQIRVQEWIPHKCSRPTYNTVLQKRGIFRFSWGLQTFPTKTYYQNHFRTQGSILGNSLLKFTWGWHVYLLERRPSAVCQSKSFVFELHNFKHFKWWDLFLKTPICHFYVFKTKHFCLVGLGYKPTNIS